MHPSSPSLQGPSARHPARAIQGLLENGHLWPLAPLALGLATAAMAKAGAFHLGLRQRQQVGVPVIAVGNLIAGGSGKTPLVAWIRDYCQSRGLPTAVVARGYGGFGGGDGQGNDEARMLGQDTYCHPQRVIAARQAIAAGAQAIILDDAFQHQQCHRDLNLVCVDATRPWGWPGSRRGACLPWGLMREPAQALRRADAVIATRCDQAPPALLHHLGRICQHWKLPLLHCQHAPQGLRLLTNPNEQHDLACLQGQAVIACSAIARPQAFAQTLRDCGAEVLHQAAFPDHHHFQAQDLLALLRQAQQRRARIVCTAKDAVKLAPLLSSMPPHFQLSQLSHLCWALDIALSFNANDEHRLTTMLHQVLKEPCP